MPRLSDIFHRSAFRVGADRSKELSGDALTAEVFEVTDLFIPAGTDWSAGHVIGSFTVDGWIGGVISQSLQVDAVPADTLVWTAASPIAFLASVGAMRVGNSFGQSFVEAQTMGFARAFSEDETPSESYTIQVGFVTADGADPNTPAPTTADITVVHARIAFLAG